MQQWPTHATWSTNSRCSTAAAAAAADSATDCVRMMPVGIGKYESDVPAGTGVRGKRLQA
eukprot:15433561-Alexandrium_andersonii.AAC.1